MRPYYTLGVFSLLLLSACSKPAPSGAPVQNAEAPPAKKVPLTKQKTSVIIDKNKAMAENPNLAPKVNKVEGYDPISTSLTGYLAAASQVNVASFQHNIHLVETMEERRLTFAEMQQYIKEYNMQFNALPDYQFYAYDDQTGEFLILEDSALKEKLHAEARK